MGNPLPAAPSAARRRSRSVPNARSAFPRPDAYILRAKGIRRFKNDDERFVFQGVHMILDGDHQRPRRDGEKRDSRIIFIGRNLPGKKIAEGFESCIS
jgi:G3E family GTPase